jgi:hypothetical protein
MKIPLIMFVIGALLPYSSGAQVKPSYLYNPDLPYGTLDLRTKISAANYFYLKENETFSFRESAPGVKTKTFRDMTDWDSSPYEEGHLRHKVGTDDQFVMNYRILKPLDYSEDFEDGYPLILMTHGGFERGNCHFENCYHADWNYDPNVDVPAAPTASDHELLNNDHNINLGGSQHIDARNRAAGRLPNDTELDERAFPGFVVIPQMMNDWDSISVENAIRIAILHTQKYNINLNRVYIHGLSIGGHAVYEAIKRAPWFFAAALPMSAVKTGKIFEHQQQNKIINIPIWIFQGGEDTKPTPLETNNFMDQLREAGATVRYTEYPDIGHAVWNRAYGEDEFFSFMLSQNKSNIYAVKGNKIIVRNEELYPTLLLPEGFFAYQWEKDGELLPDNTNTLIATAPGSYRARFSRVDLPSESDWNRWSETMLITEQDESVTDAFDDIETSVSVYPNPSSADNINLRYPGEGILSIKLLDPLGRVVYEEMNTPSSEDKRKLNIGRRLTDGMYIMLINDKENQYKKRLFIKN